ncbi:MAG TPA: cryptochrome/photolyase family protein [Fusobacteria bacterium]|nr:cryptochrome/photolyase family protein [Fusobacteriota bacterium]|tara:strand:+ start:5609 stop:7003 length:1395 start_codon:yes stop_codon:yes gene_type:complete
MNFLILPNQLFEIKDKKYKYILYEHPMFFFRDGMKFNKIRIALHRASFRIFYNDLKRKGFDVDYVSFNEELKIDNATMFDPIDESVLESLSHLKLTILNSPNFINSKEEVYNFRFSGRYSQTTFYNYQRVHRNILMKLGKPVGGKFSFDTENRKKLPRGTEIPKRIRYDSIYLDEAKKYTEKHFPSHYGNLDNVNLFPFSRETAEKSLDIFLNTNLENFGPYQDSIDSENAFLFHSNISFALNVGLLSPNKVVEKAVAKYNGDNIASVEGFVRQILGWREYMRLLYVRERKNIKANKLSSYNKVNEKWYRGTTGILPIDNTVKRAFNYGYLHHIERLMVMANFMNLCSIHPDDVYKWFMEFAVDSYDWVMLGNVYSMGLFADGGLSTTKPYVTSSNYILKMSNYKKGKWCEIWDALYYNFLNTHREIISKNRRAGSYMMSHLKNKKNLDDVIKVANSFLSELNG